MNNKVLTLVAVQASLLLTSAAAVCDTECTAASKDTSADFQIQYNGRCTPGDFSSKLDANAQACVVCLYNNQHATTLDITGVAQAMCEAGYATGVFPYTDIARKGAQFDNEHYAGGGEWNYEIQTASGEDVLQEDASRVNDVYYYEAQRKVIEFPEDIESFNPHTGLDIKGTTTPGALIDLDGCDLNAAYCCFAQDRQAGDNNGNCATPYEYNCVDKDPADNTNICYIDHERSSKSSHVSGGYSIFGDLQTGKENIEGSVHCHGFAWGDDPLHIDNVFKGNLLFYVSMYDHLTQRGYARNIPGSPMCACAENMAVVTRADCTEIASTEKTYINFAVADSSIAAEIDVRDINFNACNGLNANNNLEERVKLFESQGKVSTEKREAIQYQLVGSAAGECNAAIETFLGTKGINRTS